MNVATDEAVRLLGDLVAIESVTPWLVPGGAGEAAMVAHMAAYLENLGIEIEVDEIEPGRLNLLAAVRGDPSGGITQARQRLGCEPLKELFSEVAVPVAEEETAGAFLGS